MHDGTQVWLLPLINAEPFSEAPQNWFCHNIWFNLQLKRGRIKTQNLLAPPAEVCTSILHASYLWKIQQLFMHLIKIFLRYIIVLYNFWNLTRITINLIHNTKSTVNFTHFQRWALYMQIYTLNRTQELKKRVTKRKSG